MKLKLILFISLITYSLGFSQTKLAEENKFQFAEDEHFLDGYSLNFQYQDGKAQYEWISGSGKGNGNVDIPYRSRKTGENLHIVNWHETGKKII